VIELHMCVCVSSIHKTILIYFKNIIYIYIIYISTHIYLQHIFLHTYIHTYTYIARCFFFVAINHMYMYTASILNLQGTPDVYYIYILQVLCCPAFERGILTRDAKQKLFY